MPAKAQFRALRDIDVGRARRAALDIEALSTRGAHADGARVDLLDTRMIGVQRQVGKVDVAGRCAAQHQLRLFERRTADDLAAVCGQADLADCEGHSIAHQ